jgi:hypothetical protein
MKETMMFAGKKDSLKLLVISTMILVAAQLAHSFSFAEIGSLRLSTEVAKNFEEYRFDPGYRYYFLNLENNPFAVMGIRNDFAFHDIAWTEVNPNSEKFRKVIELVSHFPSIGRTFGAYILDSQKRTIGVWYSSLVAGVIVDSGRKTVSIYTMPGWSQN